MKCIKKIFKNEIIKLTQVSKYEYFKTYYTLNGVFRKEKLININNQRDGITDKYWSSVDNMFENLVSCRGFEVEV